jgi:hypothetical protein
MSYRREGYGSGSARWRAEVAPEQKELRRPNASGASSADFVGFRPLTLRLPGAGAREEDCVRSELKSSQRLGHESSAWYTPLGSLDRRTHVRNGQANGL